MLFNCKTIGVLRKLAVLWGKKEKKKEEKKNIHNRLGHISENINGGGISCLRLANNIYRRIYMF